MPAQDTTVLLLKLWSWVETNKNRLMAAVAVVAAGVLAVSYFFYETGQKEIVAGQALSQLFVTPGGPTADACLKVAAEFPGTLAGQRAWLQAAKALFDAGRYAEAEVQFQKFLNEHPDNQFSDLAMLGVAASLEAENKTNEAVRAYQRVTANSNDPVIDMTAKFALGRIAEEQGRFNDALVFYQDVARVGVGTSLGSQAAERVAVLRRQFSLSASAPENFTPLPSRGP
ncbi:MAG TPA: tetratricopeptide repeat protein [Verrucomicrobiae bacterium]|nr:tetratricopeptide repeat protein [Verrucomicrobiae bacterium]